MPHPWHNVLSHTQVHFDNLQQPPRVIITCALHGEHLPTSTARNPQYTDRFKFHCTLVQALRHIISGTAHLTTH